MKKSLLALAVLGSFAGAVSAQTSVTMYGVLDAGITYAGGGTAADKAGGNKLSLDSGIANGSRIGFKGTEDLGGGLKALFQLEAGVGIDTGNSNQGGVLFGRQATVGLSGDFGTVKAGRQYVPLYNQLLSIDPFELGMTGQANNLMSPGGNAGGRNTNSLRYATNNYSGFSAEVNYGFGEVPGQVGSSREIGAAVNYTNGPFAAFVAYDGLNNATNTDTYKITLVGGSIDWASIVGFPVKTSLGYATNKGSALTAGVDADSRDLILGARIPFGASEILASYVQKDDKTIANLDANQFALGYTYALSKRTGFYTTASIIKNKNGATYTVGNATNAGYGRKAFDFGIRHSF